MQLPVQLQVLQEWFAENLAGVLMVWAGTTIGFWYMGGFTPAIAQAPPRMRRQLEVILLPFPTQTAAWLSTLPPEQIPRPAAAPEQCPGPTAAWPPHRWLRASTPPGPRA